MENDGFAFGDVESDDRTAADFAAGAGCRWNGHEREKPGPIGLVVEFRPVQLWTLDEKAGGFADVERAATAEADDPVAIIFLEDRGGLVDIIFNGGGINAGVEEPGLPFRVRAKRRRDRAKGTRVDETGIGYEQRMSDIQLRQIGGQLLQCADAEERSRGKGERS